MESDPASTLRAHRPARASPCAPLLGILTPKPVWARPPSGRGRRLAHQCLPRRCRGGLALLLQRLRVELAHRVGRADEARVERPLRVQVHRIRAPLLAHRCAWGSAREGAAGCGGGEKGSPLLLLCGASGLLAGGGLVCWVVACVRSQPCWPWFFLRVAHEIEGFRALSTLLRCTACAAHRTL